MPSDPSLFAASPSPVPLLERTIGPDWRCLTDAEIRAEGERGPVDLVAIHPRHGVVLAALLRKGEEASPEAAVAAFETMLRELGFAAVFPGTLKVAAVAHEMARRDRLAEALRAAAGPAPESPPESGWMDWLGEKMAPSGKTELRLVAPARGEDAPPVDEARLEGPRERLLPELAAPGTRLWPAALFGLSLAAAAAAIYWHGA